MSPSPGRVQSALLDYFRAPGNYRLGSGQPEELFNAVREVLQIATGRMAAVDGHRTEELRDAAAFFIGAALLYPGADPYALLGVSRSADLPELKERYRLLMRLVHPDFAGTLRANWPDDSAVRVNRAYEVLSSPVRRREYDDQVASGPQHGPVKEARRAVPVPKGARLSSRGRTAKRAAWAFVVLVSLLALGLLLPHPAPVRLVQKPETAPSPGKKPAPAFPASYSDAPARQHAAAEHAVPPEPGPASQPAPSRSGADAALAAPVPPAPLPIQPGRAAQGQGNARTIVPPEPPVGRARPRDELAATPAPVAVPLPALNVPPSAPAPSALPAAAAAPAPAPAAAPAAAGAPAPAPLAGYGAGSGGAISTVAIRPWKAPTLDDAQPLITQLLQDLESGNAEQVLNLLDPVAKQAPAAQALSRQYQRIVRGTRAVKLSQVEFRSETSDDVLVVVGQLRLQVGESTIGSLGEKLLLRAEFASRGGNVRLTRLSGVAE
ncbi:MAG TPA: DnaJ domain-containing protein [Ramlibacter sp.]|uniref:J domain-containing protein n=1 Tax=Ramlibacter sp. TaxID=1917967 RepID=UPI002ED5289A